jgi:acyl carrier protein
MQNVQQSVFAILKDKLSLAESELKLEANFIKDLGVDSLDYIEIVMAFEQAFDIHIPDTDSEKLKTVGSTIDYLEERIATIQNKEEAA